MKLRILPDELETGEHLLFVGKKRRDEFNSIVASYTPIVLIAPVPQGSRFCSVIVPFDLAPTETSRQRLRFYPVWCRCFKVCHLRSTQIKMVVCEFPEGQIAFDHTGASPSTFTLSGNGVGAAVVNDAEIELGRVIDSAPNCPPVQSLIAYLKQLPVRASQAA